MNDMLSMQVSAILNITQKDLQTQLNTIRQQINETPLEIKINIDKTILSDLKEFTKAVKDINIVHKEQKQVIREEIDVIKELDGVTKTYTKTVLANGVVKERIKNVVDKNKQAIIDATKAEGKVLDELTSKYGKLTNEVIRKNAAEKETSRSMTYKDLNGRMTTVNTAGGKSTSFVERYNKEAQDRLIANLEVYKSRLNNALDKSINTITKQTAGKIDTTQLTKLKTDLNGLNVGLPNLDKSMKTINQDIKNTINNIKLEIAELNRLDVIQAQKNKFINGLTRMSNNNTTSMYMSQEEINNVKKLINSLNDLNKTSLQKIRDEIAKLGQTASNRMFTTRTLQSLEIEKTKLSDSLNKLTNSNIGKLIPETEINKVKLLISEFNTLDKVKLQNIKNQIGNLRQEANKLFDMQQAQKTLDIYKRQAEINVQSANRKYSGLVNVEELKKYQQAVNALKVNPNIQNQMAQLSMRYREITESAKNSASAMNTASKSAMTFGQSLKVAFEKFPIWIIASTAVMDFIHKIQDAFSYMLEMSQLFTNLQMEMTEKNLNFDEITESTVRYANALSSTSSEVMKAISVFGTYTSTMEQVLQRSEAAIVLANISGRSMLEVSDDLMSAQIQFKKGADELMGVVDTYASVARNLQVDFPKALGEISAGMKYVGTVATEAKIPLEDLSAMLGTLIETTRRSGQQVSNGLKTIVSRISNVGDEVNPEDFKKIEKTFNDVGVSIKKDAETIRPVNDILKDMADKWETISDVQQQQIAKDAAGIYQRNIFLALMKNYNKVLENTESAYNSQGVALSKQEIFARSLTASINQLTNSWQQFYLSVINNNVTKTLIDSSKLMLDSFTNLSDSIGGLPLVLTTALLGTSMFFSGFRNKMNTVIGEINSVKALQAKNITPSFTMGNVGVYSATLTKLITGVKTFNSNLNASKIAFATTYGTMPTKLESIKLGFNALTMGIRGTTVATLALRTATVAWQTVATLGLAVAFTYAMSGIIKYIDNLINKTEKAKQAFEELNNETLNLRDEISDSQKLIKIYDELSKKATLTAEEKDRLADATEKLATLYPNAIELYDAEGKAIDLNKDKLNEYLKVKEKELEYKRQELSASYNKSADQDVTTINNNIKSIENYNNELKELEEQKNKWIQLGKANKSNNVYQDILSDIEKITKERNKLQNETNNLIENNKTGLKAVLQGTDGFKNLNTQELNNFINSLMSIKDIYKEIEKNGAQTFGDKITKSGFINAYNDINKEFNKLSKNTNRTQQDIDNFNNNAVNKLTQNLQQFGSITGNIAENIIKNQFTLSVIEAKENIVDFSNAIELIQNTTIETSDKIELYNQILEKSKESNNDAAQEVMKHVDKHKDLYDVVQVENGILVLNTAKLNDLKNKTIETAIATNNAEINKAKIVSTQTTARLAQYQLEIEKLNTLLKIQEAYLKISNSLYTQYSTGKIDNNELFSKLDQAKKDVTDIYVANRLDSLKNMNDAEKLFEEWKTERGYSSDIKDSKEMSAMRDKIYGYVELKQAVEKANAVINTPNLGVKDSYSTSDAKSAESLVWEIVTNEIKKYDNALKSLEDTTSNMVKGSKARRDSLHAENLKIKEQIDYLKAQKDGLDTISIISNYSASNGKLPNPIPGTQLKDSFGAPRDGGARKHEGIDIMADRGTEIHSTTSGKVLSAGNTGAKGGWGVTISDPQGNTHYYAHMNTDPSKILGIGQEILAGQVIGYVGDSGNAKGGATHLHYGIKDSNNKAINPYDLLTNDISTQKSVTVNTSQSAINKYGISPEIVNTVLSLAQKYNVDPALILAIGEQETNWGKSGDGKKGMYLGYGSYDSGSDYSQAGLENQVEKAVKKMKAWGMSPGNVSFDRLNQGNNGNLPTGIYATSNEWQNGVWNLYKEFSNGQMTTALSGGLSKSELSYEKLVEDRIKHQEEINAKILELEKKFAQNSKDWYTDLWQESDNIINEFEQKSNFSKMFSESMSKSSPEYREQLSIQKNNTIGVQTQLAEQAKQMDQAIENMKKGITEGTFKDEQFLKETIEKRKALSAEWWNKQKEISDKQAEITSSEVEEVTNKINEYNNVIAISQSQQEMNEKGTNEYNNALKEEVIQYSNIESALKAKQAIYQKELTDTFVGTLRYEELQRAINDTTKEIIDNEKALYDKKKQIIDYAIETIKKAYEKQKDIAIDAIEEQIDVENERHKRVKENIEDESNQYKESVNQRIKLLDELSDKENYEADIKKLNEEKLDIQKQIESYANDDSYEAKSRKEELSKQLSDKELEIQKAQKQRELELRKDSLNDQLDKYEKEVKEKEKAEDNKYDAEKERLEKIKNDTEKHYQDLIDNELNYTNISKELMKGNIDNTISELQRLLIFVKNNISNLGSGVGNTLANEINNSIEQITGNLGSNNNTNTGNTGSNTTQHSQYYPWKTQINHIIYDKKMWQQGYETGNQQMMLDAENEAKIYYDQIPDYIAKLLQSMNYNSANAWYKTNVFHKGDVVGGTGSKEAELIDKIFNKGQNEHISKLLKGEVVLSHSAIQRVAPILNAVNTPSVNGGNSTVYNLEMYIANVNGNKEGANLLFTEVKKGINKLGKKY